MYTSIEQATLTKLDLIERIQSIEAQLTERAAEMAGVHVPDHKYKEYKEWKARACSAKFKLTHKLQRTKLWITNRNKEEAAKRIGAVGLLIDLYDAVKPKYEDLPQGKQQLLDDVEQFLNTI